MKNIKWFTLRNEMTKGFSLIEVLIFVSILSVFFVIAASVTVVSVRNMKINEHKILATHYAEELVEWLRNQKEADWTTFSARSSGNYCFNESPIDTTWVVAGECTDYGLSGMFNRDLTFSTVGSPVAQVNVKIIVSWHELGNSYQVPLTTVFTRWED